MAFSVRILDKNGAVVRVHPDIRFEPQRMTDMLYGGSDAASISMQQMESAQAEALGWLDYDVQIFGPDNTTCWTGYLNEVSGNELYCLGHWHKLDNRYFKNLKGREENTNGTGEQDLGLGFSSDEIGTLAYSNIWYEHDAKFANFGSDVGFVVSGSSNDGNYVTKSSASAEEQYSYTASTISFEPQDDIFDSADGFNNLRSNEYCFITGGISPGPADNKFHLLTSVANDHMTTREGITGIISLEAAGSSITIEQGCAVDVVEAMTTYEVPGDNTGVAVTAYGEIVAQQFYNTTGEAFTVNRIGIKIRAVGSPSDDVAVALYDDSSGAPGSLLDSGTISNSDITAVLDWHWADLNNTDSIATGTPYWIVIARVGSNEPDNFYKIGIDEELSYSTTSGGNSIRIYDGSSYQNRPIDADLAFKVWGAVETTDQITSMVTAYDQVFTGVTLFDESGIETNQWRDGTTTYQEEIEALLNIGTSSGEGFVAAISDSKRITITSQPDKDSARLILDAGHDSVYTAGLDDVFNRVKVLYTYTDYNGESISEETDWSEDADSVERYGYRELVHSESDLTAEAAETMRDRILSESAWPQLSVDVGRGALRWKHGGVVDPGRLVAGEWLTIAETPVSESGLVDASPIYIVSSEYDAQSGRLTVRPATAPDPWDVGGIEQG